MKIFLLRHGQTIGNRVGRYNGRTDEPLSEEGFRQAENVGVLLFASEWRDLIAFVIFITFLSLRPKGIFQKKENK